MIKTYSIGDGCLCWSFAEKIEETTVRKTLHIYKKLKNNTLMDDLGILDLVPSYKSVAFHFDPAMGCYESIQDKLDKIIRDEWTILENSDDLPPSEGKEIILPVSYNGEDLDIVAAHCKMDRSEVVRRHSSVPYLVAMVGFKPYFPYLMGLDPALETPRLDTPRTRIPAGAVAIGGAQTGIYPEESPGGWNLIGKTDPELLKQVEPGDTIIMKEDK